MPSNNKQVEKSPKTMSDEELEGAITQKFGNEWGLKDLDTNDQLVIEFLDRISRGQ
jgi:hypothetical protein